MDCPALLAGVLKRNIGLKDSEQGILKIKTHEESLSAVSGQGKGRCRLAQNPRVNGWLAKAIAKKYNKQQLLKKQKAKKA